MKRNEQEQKSIAELAADVAEQRRKEEAERLAEEARSKANAPKEEEEWRALMLRTAFEPWYFTKIRMALFVIFGLSLILIVGPGVLPDDTPALFGPIFFLLSAAAGAGLAYLVTQPIRIWIRRLEMKWIDRFPYNWDREAYLKILSTRFDVIHLYIKVEFESPVPSRAQSLINDATGLLMDGMELKWIDGKTLEFTSPEITACKYHHGASSSYENFNRRIHVWFTLFTANVLPVLHREYPIAMLRCYAASAISDAMRPPGYRDLVD